MKKILVALLLASGLLFGAIPGGIAPAFAEKSGPLGVAAELDAALQEMSSTELGTLTMGDLEKLAGRLSVAHQKLRYVQRARHASFMFPGAGQFMTGDALGGSLYLAGDIAVVAGTIIGAYFLLPSNVQFGSLDYLNSPLVNISTAWQSNSIVAYLPSFGVLLGGAIVKGILGYISAENAGRAARQNIADGKVTFTPNFDFDRHGFGMGMMMRY